MDAKEAIKDLERIREFKFWGQDKTELVETCISSLKKQVEKKPVFGESGFRVCPSCGGLALIYLSDHDGSNLEYCKMCGQKIDWSE